MPKNRSRSKFPLFVLVCAVVFGLASCDGDRVYESYTDIPGAAWREDFKPEFEVEIADTARAYNVILNIRNHKDYPYRNLWLLLETGYPDGNTSLDTMDLYFNDELGRELGKCSGGSCENAFLVNRKGPVKFPYSGTYTFRFSQLMRAPEEGLQHISNLGLRVEYTNASNPVK